jgi:hypothetical protein
MASRGSWVVAVSLHFLAMPCSRVRLLGGRGAPAMHAKKPGRLLDRRRPLLRARVNPRLAVVAAQVLVRLFVTHHPLPVGVPGQRAPCAPSASSSPPSRGRRPRRRARPQGDGETAARRTRRLAEAVARRRGAAGEDAGEEVAHAMPFPRTRCDRQRKAGRQPAPVPCLPGIDLLR